MMERNPPPEPDSIRLLNAFLDGDAAAGESVVERVHAELRKLAARYMATQKPEHTLQASALVNEVWLRLFGLEDARFEGRRQFYRFASRAMRSILVDHARERRAEKRGGNRRRVSIRLVDEASVPEDGALGDPLDLLDLDAALERLGSEDPDLARVVELRYFGGLTNATVADVLGVSERTVERHWRLARAWLYEELAD